MTPTVSQPNGETPKPETVTVARNVFDLDKFERRTVTKEIVLKTVKSMDEALEVSDGNEEKLVETFNKGFTRIQRLEAKASLQSDNFVSPKAVGGFVNQFKAMYPTKAGKDPETGKTFSADSPEARKVQLQQIYAFIRSQPGLVEVIKQVAAANAAQELEDEDGDGEPSAEE